MNDSYTWWLVVLGIAIGASVTLVITLRLPRREDDVPPAEREAEARWIGATIEEDGGVAPVPLVEEVLDLHADYLERGTGITVPPRIRRAVAGAAGDLPADGP